MDKFYFLVGKFYTFDRTNIHFGKLPIYLNFVLLFDIDLTIFNEIEYLTANEDYFNFR